jgi:cytochrome c oxidase subunit 2
MGSLRSKTVDDKYLKFMITDLEVWVVKGYPPIMPHIPLTNAELDALVKYVKSLEG